MKMCANSSDSNSNQTVSNAYAATSDDSLTLTALIVSNL